MIFAIFALAFLSDQFTVEVLTSTPRFTIVVIEPAIVSKPVAPTVKRREWYLVSESWCGQCVAAKKLFLGLGWPAANIITLDECDRRFGFRPKAIPFEFEEPVVKQTQTKPFARMMTHSEMVALHNRLHGDWTHWTWPGGLATHLKTTHGQNLTKE